MVAETRPRLATNIILPPFWCHCSSQIFYFCESGSVILYLQPRSAADRYPSFTGYLYLRLQTKLFVILQSVNRNHKWF